MRMTKGGGGGGGRIVLSLQQVASIPQQLVRDDVATRYRAVHSAPDVSRSTAVKKTNANPAKRKVFEFDKESIERWKQVLAVEHTPDAELHKRVNTILKLLWWKDKEPKAKREHTTTEWGHLQDLNKILRAYHAALESYSIALGSEVLYEKEDVEGTLPLTKEAAHKRTTETRSNVEKTKAAVKEAILSDWFREICAKVYKSERSSNNPLNSKFEVLQGYYERDVVLKARSDSTLVLQQLNARDATAECCTVQ